MSRLTRMLHLFPQARQDAVIAAEQSLRAPLPVIRRVAFAALSGGSGCSTTSRRAAATLAEHRSRPVLHVFAADTTLVATDSPERHRVDTLVVPEPRWPGGVTQWREACDERHREYEITVTDWGRLDLAALAEVAAHSHVVCLTTTAERLAVQHALDTAERLRSAGTPAIIVASAVRGRAGVAERRMIAGVPGDAHLVPFDQHAREDDDRLSESSHLALMLLGASIVGAGTDQRRSVSAA